MGLRPTYMDETHLKWMSFDGVDGNSPTMNPFGIFARGAVAASRTERLRTMNLPHKLRRRCQCDLHRKSG